jgi:hypothetical protein
MNCDILDYRAKESDYYKSVNDFFSLSITVTDSNDAPIDVSGYQNVEFYVDNDLIAELGDGIDILVNVINISKADTSTIGEYDFKIITTDADGVIRTLVKGKLKVE